MRYIALLLLLIAARGWGQSVAGDTTNVWTFPVSEVQTPSDYPTVGNVPCDTGYKLQRYHQAVTIQATTDSGWFDQSRWQDVDAGPHDGDYRCVKADKPVASACATIYPNDGDVAIWRNGCWVLMQGVHGGGGGQ